MATAVLVALLFAAEPASVTEDEAVAAALAHSRDLIAAKLQVDAAQVDRAAAGILPNPVLSYQLANLVVGRGNDQLGGAAPGPGTAGLNPGFFDQPVQTFTVSQVIDIWFKRSKRVDAAERSVEATQLLVEQAVREVSAAVKGAYADALRAQEERLLAIEAREHYDDTVRLSASRLKVGDISETDYKKIELELLRYKNDELQSALAAELARQRLAALMVLPPGQVPQELKPTVTQLDQPLDPKGLYDRALKSRPDFLAADKGVERAQAMVSSQQREAYPDVSLFVGYTRDSFTVSGDNPNTLAVGLSLPLPLFDRNQGGVGHARVDLRAAENDRDRLKLQIEYDVVDAVRRVEVSKVQLKLLTDDVAPRAAQALRVAEKSYQAGAINLLELLEAQRTYVEVRRSTVASTYQFRQAAIDLVHAVGGNP